MPGNKKLFEMETSYGTIGVSKKGAGAVIIKAGTTEGMAYGLGWLHGTRRGQELVLTRAMVQGKFTSLLKPTPALLDADRFIRTLDLFPNPEDEIASLEAANRSTLQAYCYGVNAALAQSQWKKQPKWTMEDSLLIAKTLGVFSWLETNYEVHRYLQKMVKDGMSESKIRELFPESTTIDLESWVSSALLPELPAESANWLALAPRWRGFNAILLGKDLTTTQGPLLAFSWMMDSSRPGSPFFNFTWHSPEGKIGGWGLPGIPGVLAGFNPHVTWAGAPSQDDNWRLVLENVRKSLIIRENETEVVETKQETYILDAKHQAVETRGITGRGVLVTYPPRDGVSGVLAWAGRHATGTLNMMMNILHCQSATEGAEKCSSHGSPLLEWVFTDRNGNLARTQSGAQWDLPHNPCSWIPLTQCPPLTLQTPSPEQIETAGDGGKLILPRPGRPGAHYQSERLRQLITPSTRFSPSDLERILSDDYSLQGQKVMAELRFTLPENSLGKALRSWDWTCRGQRESLLFEELHLDVLQTLFGKTFSSLDIWKEFHHDSGVFHEMLPRFDACLFNPVSTWTNGLSKEKALAIAVKETSARAERDSAPKTLDLHPSVWKEKKHPRPKNSGFTLTGGRYSVHGVHMETLGGRLCSFLPRIKAIFDPAGNQAWVKELDLGDGDASMARRSRGLKDLFVQPFKHEFI